MRTIEIDDQVATINIKPKDKAEGVRILYHYRPAWSIGIVTAFMRRPGEKEFRPIMNTDQDVIANTLTVTLGNEETRIAGKGTMQFLFSYSSLLSLSNPFRVYITD